MTAEKVVGEPTRREGAHLAARVRAGEHELAEDGDGADGRACLPPGRW